MTRRWSAVGLVWSLLVLLATVALAASDDARPHERNEAPLNFAAVSAHLRDDGGEPSVILRYRTQPCVEWHCIGLPLTGNGHIAANATTPWTLLTVETSVTFELLDASGKTRYNRTVQFGDRGAYLLEIGTGQDALANGAWSLQETVVRKPDVKHGVDSLPLLYLTFAIVGLCVLSELFKRLYIFERIPCLQPRQLPEWTQNLLGIETDDEDVDSELGEDSDSELVDIDGRRRGSHPTLSTGGRHSRQSSRDKIVLTPSASASSSEATPLLSPSHHHAHGGGGSSSSSRATGSSHGSAPPSRASAKGGSNAANGHASTVGGSGRIHLQAPKRAGGGGGGGTLQGETPIGRINSLDTVRGLAFCALIFVQAGGGQYPYMRQSVWNGLTIADLIEPGLLWVMGCSMALSLNRRLSQRPRPVVMRHVAYRTIWLFFIGLVIENPMNATPFNEWRISGPLQRFAFVYFVVATVVLYVPLTSEFVLESNPPALLLKGRHRLSEFKVTTSLLKGHGRMAFLLRDVGPYTWEWLVMATLMVIHAFTMYYLNVPGCGKGYLGPGGITELGRYSNCTGGAQGYIDKKILGDYHQDPNPTTEPWFYTGRYESEGILGHLSAVGTAYFGVHAAHSILHFRHHKIHVSRITRWMFWCIVFGFLALVLCGAHQNSGAVPVNKNLWSLSFTAVCACMSFFLFAVVYYLVDCKKWWTGTPMRQLGLNPIMVYVGSKVLHGYFPFDPFHINSGDNLSRGVRVAHDAASVFVWVVIAIWLERRGVRFAL